MTTTRLVAALIMIVAAALVDQRRDGNESYLAGLVLLGLGLAYLIAG